MRNIFEFYTFQIIDSNSFGFHNNFMDSNEFTIVMDRFLGIVAIGVSSTRAFCRADYFIIQLKNKVDVGLVL